MNVTPDMKSAEVLSQSEVERLLSQVQAEEAGITVVRSGGVKVRVKNEQVLPCDFRQASFLAGNELRKIRIWHEDFLSSLATELSINLRLDVNIKMSKLQTLVFQKYVDSIAGSTHVTMFQVEPLKGICLLDMAPRLAATIVDRLLGGPGHSVEANATLGQVEVALLDEVVQLILHQWCRRWHSMENSRPVIVGHENNSRFLTTSAHDTVMVVLSTEVRLGDCLEQMQMSFPFFTIEPLLRLACAENSDDGPRPPMQSEAKVGLDHIPLSVAALCHGLQMSARELAGLKRGDVLMMDHEALSRIEVLVATEPKFFGRLGTSGDQLAVEFVGSATK
jgi:flagellar motor switch protein FliM